MPERHGIDRDLLQRAGEHLGTLAEDWRNRADLVNGKSARRYTENAVLLWRLSAEILKVANE